MSNNKLKETFVVRDLPDGRISSKNVLAYDFISEIHVNCKYYQN